MPEQCINLPAIPEPPSLPAGIGIKPPPLPRPPASLLCCKLPPIPPKVLAMIAKYEAGKAVTFPPMPAAIQAVLVQLDEARVVINNYVANLPLSCPKSVEKAIGAAP